MTQFVNPNPPGQGIQWDTLAGRLLLIEVGVVENAIKTAFGDSDAVRASVTVLDGDTAGTEHTD